MFCNAAINPRHLMLCASAAALAAAVIPGPAMAQSAQGSSAATETAVGELLQGLVNKKVLSRKDAQEMMDRFHTTMARSVEASPPPPPEAGSVRVPYVSETVKEEITNRLKDKVVQQAKDEHWATPRPQAEWTDRIKLTGDVRLRDEGRYFGKNNYYAFVNVGSINSGSPYNTDSNNTVAPPLDNTTKDRNLLRVRARVGLEAHVADDWTALVRIATGSDSSPVSTNQTLGGFYAKKSIWLDQAYIKYEPVKGNALMVGRMPNPFEHTELVWDDDINLDGIAASARYALRNTPLTLKAVAGAFPLDYVPDNFPSNGLTADGLSDEKVGQGGDKWLFAGQIGAAYHTKRAAFSLMASYYDFENIQGKLSPACSNEAAYCLTDYTRPAFMQKGNTLFALRQLTFPVSTDTSQPQYYGIASKFQVLDLIAKADLTVKGDFHLVLTGDYARNLGYSKNAVTALPIANNNETCSVIITDVTKNCTQSGGTNIFKSGNNAWSVQLTAGHPTVDKAWDWNASFSYLRLDPDATLDAFTNSDFHLGGTNAKGWVIGGNLGLAKNVVLSARWLSADAVYGPPMAVDIFQLDLTTTF